MFTKEVLYTREAVATSQVHYFVCPFTVVYVLRTCVPRAKGRPIFSAERPVFVFPRLPTFSGMLFQLRTLPIGAA